MNPQTQLDPQVVNMAKAVRQVETGGNFQAQGKSGEFGAYQFTPDTWASSSQKYLGQSIPLEQATPEQQNQVAYSKLKELKDQGLNVGQVASVWNSGDPNKYTDSSAMGVNQYGAKYDVPAYARNVAAAYQKIKSGSSVGIDPQNPSTITNQAQQLTASEGNQQDPGFFKNLFSGNLGAAGKNVLDFAFPIVQDVIDSANQTSKKTTLQTLGDLGLSALWFVPGLGEAGLGAKILEGAGLGYGAGALTGLASGKGLGESLAPSTQNVLGALTGGVAGGALSKVSGLIGKNLTEQGALKAVEDNIGSALGATKSGRGFISESTASGFNPAKLAAESLSIPDIVDGKFVTDTAEKNVNNRIGQLSSLRAAALDQMGKSASLNDITQELLTKSKGQFLGTAQQSVASHIDSEMAAYEGQFGKNPSISDLEKIKEDLMSKTNYDATRPSQITQANKMMANAIKTKIEKLAEETGFKGMKEYNNLIASHYNLLDALQKINGQTVRGGRLGNILRGHTIAGISGMAASAAGGGIPGTILAVLAGEGGNAVLSKIISDNSFSNPIRDRILAAIEQENPEIVQKLQSQIGMTGGIVAPKAIPKATSQIVQKAPGLLTQAFARGGAALTR